MLGEDGRDMSIGWKFASVEHRWEKRTNYVIIMGIIITGVAYFYNLRYIIYNYTLSAAELGILFLLLTGFVHLIARLGHKGEQFFLKKYRPWRK
jgi:hypothetical protein